MFVFPDNPSPENRYLKEVLRELEGILPDRSTIHRTGPGRRYRKILNAIAIESPTTRRLTALLDGASYFIGGDEHRIVQVPGDRPERIYKITHSNSFGCRSEFHPSDPDLLGRHFFAGVNVDLLYYLEPWICLNSISTYQTQFEGFLPPDDERHYAACLRQPARAPASDINPSKPN